MESTDSRCDQCGALAVADARYCTQCGKALHASTPPEFSTPDPSPNNHNNREFWGGVVGSILGFLFALAALLLLPQALSAFMDLPEYHNSILTEERIEDLRRAREPDGMPGWFVKVMIFGVCMYLGGIAGVRVARGRSRKS